MYVRCFILPSRYGREDEELMGLRFCNEIVIAAEQLHPSPTTAAAAAAATAATANHSSSSDGAGRPGGRKRSKDKGEEREASASKEGGKKKEPAISVEASADASGVKKLQVNQVNQFKSFPAN